MWAFRDVIKRDGALGFLMRRFDFPIAPVVVGLILGPIAESQLRRALAVSPGDPLVLLQSPMSATERAEVQHDGVGEWITMWNSPRWSLPAKPK